MAKEYKVIYFENNEDIKPNRVMTHSQTISQIQDIMETEGVFQIDVYEQLTGKLIFSLEN